MKTFFDKEEYSEKDIEDLIKDKIEESTYLEFKQAESLTNKNKVKTEITKDVSALANSAGGIIIYGIKEKDHAASELSFIDGNVVTKEWLDQVINTGIVRRVTGIKIFPIRFKNRIEQSVYLVKVPESKSAPHMAKDNKYYRRYNFEVKPMEEYEVRSLYFKSRTTQLDIPMPLISRPNESASEIIDEFTGVFQLHFCLSNVGNVVEKNYKVEIILPQEFDHYLNKKKPILDHKEDTDVSPKYVVFGEKLIFPYDNIPIFYLYFKILPDFPWREIKNRHVFVNLFYSGGILSRKFSFKEIFNFNRNRSRAQNLQYRTMRFD